MAPGHRSPRCPITRSSPRRSAARPMRRSTLPPPSSGMAASSWQAANTTVALPTPTSMPRRSMIRCRQLDDHQATAGSATTWRRPVLHARRWQTHHRHIRERLQRGQHSRSEYQIYEPTGAKGDNPSEETWILLPNGNVLAVQCSNAPNAEQYNPTTNEWISAGSTPSNLTQPCSGEVAEIGLAILLPSTGDVFCIGASGATALYTPGGATVAGTWAAGPDLVDGSGNGLSPWTRPRCYCPAARCC